MPAKINYTFTPHYSLVESRATFETKNSLRKFRILPGFIGVDSWCVGFCFATVESIPVQKQLKIFFAPVFRLASSDQQLWFFSLLYGMANRWLICDQFQHLLTRLLSNLNEARTKVQPHKLGKNNYETNRIKRFFLQSIVSEITVVRLSSTRNTNQRSNERASEKKTRTQFRVQNTFVRVLKFHTIVNCIPTATHTYRQTRGRKKNELNFQTSTKWKEAEEQVAKYFTIS